MVGNGVAAPLRGPGADPGAAVRGAGHAVRVASVLAPGRSRTAGQCCPLAAGLAVLVGCSLRLSCG